MLENLFYFCFVFWTWPSRMSQSSLIPQTLRIILSLVWKIRIWIIVNLILDCSRARRRSPERKKSQSNNRKQFIFLDCEALSYIFRLFLIIGKKMVVQKSLISTITLQIITTRFTETFTILGWSKETDSKSKESEI